jgi:uncharacterized membrane protein YidH (DUF202 family)
MKKIAMGVTITVVAGIILGLTTWNFAATQNSVRKDEYEKDKSRIEQKLDKIYEKILELHTGGS